jgi:hypothetical protein
MSNHCQPFAVLAAAAFAAAGASATVIDFDSYPDNTLLNSQYSGLGVTFSATTSAIIADIIAAGPGYATSSPRNIAFADWNGQVQGTLRVDFAFPASGVSFFAIDVGYSSRDAIAYDSLGNVLQTITIYNPSTSSGIGNIDSVVFTVSNISYFTFGQGAIYGVGDGSGIDDLSFTIPAPGVGAIGVIGGLARMRRRPLRSV